MTSQPSNSDFPRMNDLARVFEQQSIKASFLRLSQYSDRIKKIQRIQELLLERRHELYQALKSDLAKPISEIELTEILPVLSEAKTIIKSLKKWMKPKKVKNPWLFKSTAAYYQYEPKGVCLILTPWNYPINLTLTSLMSCLAAGNTAIVKPSEQAPASAQFLVNLLASIFEDNEVCVVQGGADVAEALLKLPFDHCFFIGSTAVGKKVMQACSAHLTSVTLELGGKSPAIVDETAIFSEAARSLVFGKFQNAGQTCIAPDYLMLESSISDAFIQELIKKIEKFYGSTIEHQKRSPDYGCMISEKHAQRALDLIQDAVARGAKIVYGGEVDIENRFVQPTLLVDLPLDARLLREEIFAPILPILRWCHLDDVIAYLDKNPVPLALYLYSRNHVHLNLALTKIRSGDVAINTCVAQFAHPNLPFGGQKQSGQGKMHGFYSFQAFSHTRSILKNRIGLTALVAPPYGFIKIRWIRYILKYLI
jgi:aldehyde dehydrogenase (NAD+)